LIVSNSEACLYVAGLNQKTVMARQEYKKAQLEFAKSLIEYHEITKPFYIVFLPTPGKKGHDKSIWDSYDIECLKSCIHIENLSAK